MAVSYIGRPLGSSYEGEGGGFPDVMPVATLSRGTGGCHLNSLMGVNGGLLEFSSRGGGDKGSLWASGSLSRLATPPVLCFTIRFLVWILSVHTLLHMGRVGPVSSVAFPCVSMWFRARCFGVFRSSAGVIAVFPASGLFTKLVLGPVFPSV